MTKDQLQTIEYVKEHLQVWMKEQNIIPFPQRNNDTEIIERIVRVEEGLKHQNENIERLIFHMDQRFQSSDNHYSELREDMNRRFSRQGQFLMVIFATIVTSALATLFQLR